MVWLKALGVAFATYSKIPMPKLAFDAPERERALVFFPLVGLVQGGVDLALIYLTTRVLSLPLLLIAIAWLFVHHYLTGFIHLDGFLDVQDALSAHTSKEEQLRIMKDPQLGAFGVVYGIFYLLAEFVVFYLLAGFGFYAMVVLPFLYAYLRTFSGAMIYGVPKAKKDGLAVLFAAADGKRYRFLLAVQGVIYAVIMFYLLQCPGILFFSAAVVIMNYLYKDWLKERFGGVTGDLAGHALMLLELIGFYYLYFFLR